MKSIAKQTLTTVALSAFYFGSAHAGVIAYYSFDTDFSDGAAAAGGGTLTTLAGDPDTTSTASEVKFGSGALELDGNDTLSIPTPFTFSASDTWSVSFWGKRASGAGAASGMILGSDGGGSEFIWTPDNSSVVQGLRFRNNGGDSADFGGIPDDNAYHHWVIIADGTGSVEVYRDNASLSSISIATNATFDAVGTGAGSNNIYNGSIDELYIFDEAIDSDVVASLFTSNVVPEPGSLALLGLGGLLIVRRRR
ncbi:MAG: LamG-like jellyroll fold domain-containing protein [Planctomycetota bacterium]